MALFILPKDSDTPTEVLLISCSFAFKLEITFSISAWSTPRFCAPSIAADNACACAAAAAEFITAL